MNTLSEEEALTAMCLWEEVLSRDSGAFAERCEKVGTAEFRNEILTLAEPVNTAYETVAGDFPDPFDWEFVPAMLHLIEENLDPNIPISLDNKTANQMAKSLVQQ